MRWLLACVVWVSLAVPAQAADTTPTLDVQLFHPAPGGNDFITTQSADVNSSFALSLGLSINYARNPLSVKVLQNNNATEPSGAIVKSRIDADLLVGLGLFNVAEIGLVMPFVYQGGFEKDKLAADNIELGNGPKSFTQGDLRIVPKIRFMHLADGAVSGALVATIVVPTSQKAPYASEPSAVVVPGLALSSRTGPVRLALNAGYAVRNETTIETLTIHDQIVTSFALGVNLSRDPDKLIELVAEVFGHTPSNDILGLKDKGIEKEFAKAATSLEGDIGLRLSLGPNLVLSVGGGGGILPGYGAPSPRVYAGIGFYTGDSGIADADKDGVADDLDKCPDKKEDRDGFEDTDGCPDVDNDNDGIPDDDDQCPNEVEDKDSYQDEDGCPDPDNDGDGIADAVDKCPTEPEDFDGFQDEDGCPDYDNDNDGIPDAIDKCPNEAEDKDGFEDQDGCPDPDNDGDGLNDINDLCPNNAEDRDGVEDDDGCPDDNDKDGIPDELDKCPNEAETYNGINDDDGCPEKLKVKQLVKVTQDKIEIKDKIFFRTNSAVIMPRSFSLLDQVVSVLKNYKHITKVRIEGHTDSTGSRRVNIKLSRERAESVRDYLVQKGIDRDRLEAEGYGPDKPIASNRTARGREMNRRVEFVIVEQKPLGVDVAATQKAAEPTIEMPGLGGEAPQAPTPATTTPPSGGESLFEVGPEPSAPTAPAPAPAAGEEKGKKGKPAKKGKQKKKEEPEVDFNF